MGWGQGRTIFPRCIASLSTRHRVNPLWAVGAQAWRDSSSSHIDVLAAQHTKLYLGGGYKGLGGGSNKSHLSNGCMCLCARQCVNNLLLNGTKSWGRRGLKDWDEKRWRVVEGWAASSLFWYILYTQCFAGATELNGGPPEACSLTSTWSPKRQNWRARPLSCDSLLLLVQQPHNAHWHRNRLQ